MNKFGITQSLAIGEFHPLFRSILWVSAARSDDETRLALTYVHVEREGLDYHIVATDGKRMHVSTFDPGMFDEDFESIEAGSYEVVAKSTKFIVVSVAEDAPKFPNWRALMPTTGERPMLSERVCSRTISALCIRTGVLLATDFLIEAIGYGNGFKKDCYVSVDFAKDPEGNGPFLIRHELGRAVVMPMSMRDNSAAEPTKDDAEATPEIPSITAHFDIKPTGDPVSNLAKCLGPVESIEITAGGEGVRIEHGKPAKRISKKTESIQPETTGEPNDDELQSFCMTLAKCKGKTKKQTVDLRQTLMDNYLLHKGENAFLRAWAMAKSMAGDPLVIEQLAVVCREIDPTGDF